MSNDHNKTQFDFEEFNPTPRPAKNGFNVAIYRHHRELRMNRQTYEAIGSPTSVTLLYDERRRVIGVRPIYDDATNAIKVTCAKDGHAGFLMYEFLNRYSIDLPASIRFLAPHIQDGLLILERDRTTTVRDTRKRTRREME